MSTPIQIHIDLSLQAFNVPLAQYLSTNPQYDRLVVSAFIFDPPRAKLSDSSRQPRILIVQRAAHESSYANFWEVPGGSSDARDPTILHSLAREVFEESGLKMNKVLRQIGDVLEFTTGWGSKQKRWAKLSFEIEVAEITDQGAHSSSIAHQDAYSACQNQAHDVAQMPKGKKLEVAVTIDPNEHQSFAWATLEDLRTNRYAITTREQRDLIFHAFELQENE